MHKQRWNAVKMELNLVPRSPLLIKSGRLSPNPALPDMQFVRTVTPQGEVVFLPGSSLKGPFRSFTEKVLRTVNAEWACDPFSSDFCGKKLEKEGDSAKVYSSSCYTCRVYGNTRLKGRLAFTDAFPEGEVKTEVRHGVAISRTTQSVAVGPFDIEVLVQGRFRTTLVLENFETWQLGLVALTFRALNEGMLKMGFGKNRGFGEVELQVRRAFVEMAPRAELSSEELWGTGAFLPEEERRRYGLDGEDRLTAIPRPREEERSALLIRRTYDPEGWGEVLERAIEALGRLEGR